MQIDSIDFQILQLLNKNARIQWKEIGEKIHMTGQAVGNRIKKWRITVSLKHIRLWLMN